MVKLRWLLCLGLLASQGALASVTTSLDRGAVAPGQSVVVTYDADQNVGRPDFAPLKKNFDILDQSRSRSISILNGKTHYDLKWTLVLMPKSTGDLKLPSIHFGSERSRARTIKVLSGSARAGGKRDVFVDYKVDDPTPYVNEQVLVTVQVYTGADVNNLDISTPRVVEGRGSIDKLGRLHRYHSVRGTRRYVVHEQRYTLVPQSAGDMKLSAVRVRASINGSPLSERTKALELNVLPATAAGSRRTGRLRPKDLFVEVSVDKKSPYVQEQVVYTARVFRAVDIDNATLSTPRVSGGDAVVERIGPDHHYQTTRNGRQYGVTERRFVVFPQVSGTLTIRPLLLSASIPLSYSAGSMSNFFSLPLTRPVRVRSAAVELNVRPPPANAPTPWLPASHVTLEEDWPSRDSVEVGTPITRRITVKAEDLLSSELPDLKITLPDGIKSYPERPRRNDSVGPKGVTGRLEQTIAVIPSKPGTFILPGIDLAWWNTGSNREETLSLPAHTLHVRPNPAASAPPASSKPAEKTPIASAPIRKQAASGVAWSRWVSVALGAAWVLTLLLWWLDRRRAAGPAPAGDSDQTAVSRRRARKKLREACQLGDPAECRQALLEWARACWPERPPRSLGTLGRRVDGALAAEIAALQQALYAPAGASWGGDGLYRAVRAFALPASRQARDEAILKPLYEH